MRIGVPKERLDGENRVAATPDTVRALIQAGHQLIVESDAGTAIGMNDADYTAEGAQLGDPFDADLILKVKQPLPDEANKLQEGQILFTFLHLAAHPDLVQSLIDHKVTAMAYETLTDSNGKLPLLAPMSQIAGRVAAQEGALSLESSQGGRGVLLAGVPGTPPAKVVVLGGGNVGTEAARIAMGMGADVTVVDISQERLAFLDQQFGPRLKTAFNIEEEVRACDLLIGAVLIPGGKTPRLVSESLVKEMRPGSAIVDVAIDQGGCIATSRPTTLSNPRYIVHDIVHYCVDNIPATCAETATIALTHATLPYILRLADNGPSDPILSSAINISDGKVIHPALARIYPPA